MHSDIGRDDDIEIVCWITSKAVVDTDARLAGCRADVAGSIVHEVDEKTIMAGGAIDTGGADLTIS